MTYSVPDICDDFPEAITVLEPIFSDFGKKCRFCGEIVTIKCFEDNSLVRDLVNTPGDGRVIIVDGGGSLRHALLGDLLAASAAENGWSGLVINGCVRDYPLKTEKRGEGQLNIPVSFAGVRFRPGQFLYADANGMVIADGRLEADFQQDC